MSGQLKEVRNRIKSTQGTQQITKAMKMVSAAKLRKAQDIIIKFRPYSKGLAEICQQILVNESNLNEIPYIQQSSSEKILLLLITSDRGLCGGYNSNLIKLIKSTINDKYPHKNVDILPIGKKGFEAFSKSNFNVIKDFKDLLLNCNYSKVKDLANKIIKDFIDKKYGQIEIIYSHFKNAASQLNCCETFLPLIFPKPTTKTVNDFIFEPEKITLLNSLIPQILTTQLYKCLLDAQASEHGARMTAMDKASDNANELLKTLKISYNRARQAAITTELTEIVSGAAALKG